MIVTNSAIARTPRSPVLLRWVRTRLLAGHLRPLATRERVLDLCCGWGFHLALNPRAWGVDADPAPVEHLRGKGYHVTQADILQPLPFPDHFFDAVLAHDTLEHFTPGESGRIFQEVYRILRPHGLFLVVVPNRKGYRYGLRTRCGHKHFLTPPEVRRLAGDRFIVVREHAHPFPRPLGRYFTHNKEVLLLEKR